MNPSPTYQVVDVTPEIAAKWLIDNTHNRALNERVVDVYAGAMARGEWRENGEAIRFSRPPRVLLDGQKRLTAVVKSGCTVRLLVIEGLDNEVQRTIDTGQKRSFGDTLNLEYGISNYCDMAAVVNKLYRWKTGQLRGLNRPATVDQLLSLYIEHGDSLNESLRVARTVRRQLPVSGSTMALAHHLFALSDPGDCEVFFLRLRDGQGLVDGDPIFALRKTLLNNLAAGPGRGRYNDVALLALVIKAWNAWRAGETVKVLYWRAGGASPEAFPEPA